jgi:hypothetical protein
MYDGVFAMRLAHCYIEGLPVWKASLLVIKNTTVPARPENKTTERRSQPAALCALRADAFLL